ncbi:TPA: two-component system sensor histidine kinase DltS [Streptococcus agalactiae]
MFSDLRKKFVFLTMSILIVVVLFLFAVSNRYNQYWDEYDAYRIVKLVAKNDYLGIPGDEPIALVTIDNQKMVKIQSNNTDLTNDVIEKSSLKLLEQGKKSRKWKSFIYSIKEYKDKTYTIAIMDLASYEVPYAMRFLILVFTIFGFCLLAAVSLYLSRFIVGPVETEMTREKQFVSDASHELKTPIAAIRANVQVLEQQIPGNRYLDHVVSETKRMEFLIEDLLNLSRLDEKRSKVNFKKLNLSVLCQEVLLTYESLAYEEEKCLNDTIEDDVWIVGEESQIKQILIILLDNAIRHSLSKSAIQFSLKQARRKAILTISNPSAIYSKEVMDNLFERFYQAKDDHADSLSFGLGLSIAKAIVERHKGRIRAYQEKDQLRLEVQLPIDGFWTNTMIN